MSSAFPSPIDRPEQARAPDTTTTPPPLHQLALTLSRLRRFGGGIPRYPPLPPHHSWAWPKWGARGSLSKHASAKARRPKPTHKTKEHRFRGYEADWRAPNLFEIRLPRHPTPAQPPIPKNTHTHNTHPATTPRPTPTPHRRPQVGTYASPIPTVSNPNSKRICRSLGGLTCEFDRPRNT